MESIWTWIAGTLLASGVVLGILVKLLKPPIRKLAESFEKYLEKHPGIDETMVWIDELIDTGLAYAKVKYADSDFLKIIEKGTELYDFFAEHADLENPPKETYAMIMKNKAKFDSRLYDKILLRYPDRFEGDNKIG